MQNACTNAPAKNLLDIFADRDIWNMSDSSFSTKLDKWTATNQKMSGRCWLFAVLNMFRAGTMQKLNVKDFEFSQSYIHFWDKFERANHFFGAIINLADKDVDDRTVHHLLNDPIGDGGQWGMAINLVRKHGLVPKTAFPESTSSSCTRWMNAQLSAILRCGARELREMIAAGTAAELVQAHKTSRMNDIYRMLATHLGTPPTSFDWQWEDKDDVFHRKGVMTPVEFAAEYVTLDYEDCVCIVHDPRNPYYQTYTVDLLQSVSESPPILYLNVPLQSMKNITRRMLQDGTPVWMGCDVGKQMHRQRGLWDAKLFDYEAIYGSAYAMNKADRLRYGQTCMTHAMLFTGVDVVAGTEDAESPTCRRWRVENSWGTDESGIKGFYTMNDNWYDEHMFEISAPKQYLSAEMLEGLKTEVTVLPAWDPMGSLAKDEEALCSLGEMSVVPRIRCICMLVVLVSPQNREQNVKKIACNAWKYKYVFGGSVNLLVFVPIEET